MSNLKFIRLTEYYDGCPIYKSIAPGTTMVPVEHGTRIISPGDVITEEFDSCLYVHESVPEIVRLLADPQDWSQYAEMDRVAMEGIWKTPMPH